ncbi:MAG: hypothetical protein ACI97B_003492, partial [Verrucomicrobiales bacterium]
RLAQGEDQHRLENRERVLHLQFTLQRTLIGLGLLWLLALGSWLMWSYNEIRFHPIPYPFDDAAFS